MVTHQPNEEKYFTVQEVAARLHVSDKTVYRRVEMLELRAHKIGRAVRISRAELQRYLDSHATVEEWEDNHGQIAKW